jgi:hypothetical protein
MASLSDDYHLLSPGVDRNTQSSAGVETADYCYAFNSSTNQSSASNSQVVKFAMFKVKEIGGPMKKNWPLYINADVQLVLVIALRIVYLLKFVSICWIASFHCLSCHFMFVISVSDFEF